MIGLLVFLVGVLALVMGLLVYYFRRDQGYLNAKPRDAMSETVKKELDDEIEDSKRRQEKFKNSLANAAKLAKSQDNSLT